MEALLAAFFIGIAGSGHCIGMCGGISSLIVLSDKSNLSYLISYNIGRITSYGLVATLLSTLILLGQEATYIDLMTPLRTASGLILIFTGAYLLGISKLIIHIEKTGKWLWRYVAPLAKSLLPVNSAPKAIAAGFIWGWLPCGLVYSTVIWSVGMSNGSPTFPAALLLAFGLGTIPAMLLTGLAAKEFRAIWQQYKINYLFGFLLITYGIWSIPYVQGQFSSLFD